MSRKNPAPTEIPLWQQLTGLTPDREQSMSADQRDEAIRILVKEVDTRARVEFERGKITPPGERTVLWDPLQRICTQLGISRTKLSAYARELTGMRAHELTDRIKAATLPAQLQARLVPLLEQELKALTPEIDRARLGDSTYRFALVRRVAKTMREQRRGDARTRFAIALGFPNASRLSRACLLAHHTTIDDLEARQVYDIVQKFCAGLAAKPAAPATAPYKEAGKPAGAKRAAASAPETPLNPEAQAILDDVVDAVLSRTFHAA